MSDAGSPRILYCHCAYAQAVPKPVKQQVLQTLTASGVEFEAVPDLCEMSAKRDPALGELAGCGALTIVACYPRAVTWLFNAAGAPLPEGVRVLNMRTETAEAVAAALARRTERGAGARERNGATPIGGASEASRGPGQSPEGEKPEPVGESEGRSPSVKR